MLMEYCKNCHRLMPQGTLRCPGCGTVKDTTPIVLWYGLWIFLGASLAGLIWMWLTS